MITAKLHPCPICNGPVCIRQQGYFQEWAVVCEKCRLVMTESPSVGRDVSRLIDKLAAKWNSMEKGE